MIASSGPLSRENPFAASLHACAWSSARGSSSSSASRRVGASYNSAATVRIASPIRHSGCASR